MSEAQLDSDQEQTHTAEEKFFGVKTQIGKRSETLEDEDGQYELEIIDDRPEEDRRPPKTEASSDDIDDEELSGYSEKVQKRINKLRYEQHEERRKREAAEKMREEAVRFAEQVNRKNQENEALISRCEHKQSCLKRKDTRTISHRNKRNVNNTINKRIRNRLLTRLYRTCSNKRNHRLRQRPKNGHKTILGSCKMAMKK
jgi:hypothetical protein